MARTVRTQNAAATERLAAELAHTLSPNTVVALHGALGSGKTVFVRGLARGLGITEPVTSPSFTIVSEYESTTPLVHVDLYRTESSEELELLGLEEICLRNAVIAVEWAEKAYGFLPDDRIHVTIAIAGEEREIRIDGIEHEHTDT